MIPDRFDADDHLRTPGKPSPLDGAARAAYLRRWLDPSDELRAFEVKISLDAHQQLRELLERAKADGAVDPAFPVETFLRSFTWLIYGYFATGPIDWRDWFSDPLNPAHLEDLRRLVTLYVRQSLAASWS